MTRDEFERAMRLWGWVHGERPERELDEGEKARAVHPIARAMEFGDRTKDKRTKIAYTRHIRPGERSWSRDPISCTETRAAIGSAPVAPSKSDRTPLIQAAWLELKRSDEELAEAVRLEYQCRDDQAQKAKTMGVGRNKFRELVAEGKGRIFNKLENLAAAA